MIGLGVMVIFSQATASGEEAPLVASCTPAPTGMSCVPGGWFLRGKSDDAHICKQRFGKYKSLPNAKPEQRVWVQTFYMDTHEVTVEEFGKCIAAKACHPRREDGKWGPRYTDFSHPQQPVTGASWFQAQEYCQWKGKRLPTEAQWEKAARGDDGELYPWGNAPTDCAHAVIKDERGRSCGVRKRGTGSVGKVLPVGSRPAGRYGIYDLIGNAEEWVADWYTHSWAECGNDCSGIEPKGPCQGAPKCPGHMHKAVRGGSWYWDASHATSWHRRPHIPANTVPKRFHHFGFRCAATPQDRALAHQEAQP